MQCGHLITNSGSQDKAVTADEVFLYVYIYIQTAYGVNALKLYHVTS